MKKKIKILIAFFLFLLKFSLNGLLIIALRTSISISLTNIYIYIYNLHILMFINSSNIYSKIIIDRILNPISTLIKNKSAKRPHVIWVYFKQILSLLIKDKFLLQLTLKKLTCLHILNI